MIIQNITEDKIQGEFSCDGKPLEQHFVRWNSRLVGNQIFVTWVANTGAELDLRLFGKDILAGQWSKAGQTIDVRYKKRER